MTLNQIQAQMASALLARGVSAEITFINACMFSVLVDDAAQFEAAKEIMAQVRAATFDSQDVDPECGSIAYYRF
jgi:hypothetical protein